MSVNVQIIKSNSQEVPVVATNKSSVTAHMAKTAVRSRMANPLTLAWLTVVIVKWPF